MKLPPPGYFSLALAAACLLGAGFAAGYLTGRTDPGGNPASGSAAAAVSAYDARGWAESSLSALTRDLELTPAQQEEVSGVLREAAAKIEGERERALLQIHLQLLETHDLLQTAAGFTGSRKERLAVSREKLRALIISRFSSILESTGETPSPL